MTDFFAEVEAAAAVGGTLFGVPDYLPLAEQEAIRREHPVVRAALIPRPPAPRIRRMREAWAKRANVGRRQALRNVASIAVKPKPAAKLAYPGPAIWELVNADELDAAQALITAVQAGREDDLGLLKVARKVAWMRGAITLAVDLAERLVERGEFDPEVLVRMKGNLRELSGYQPSLPGPVEPIQPASDDLVLNLAKMSRPFLSNGYTSRSHRNFLAAKEAGITTVVVTELGFPRTAGFEDFASTEAIDGIEHRRLDVGPDVDIKNMPVDQWLDAFAREAYAVVRDVRPALLHVSSGNRGYETMLVALAIKAKTGLPVVYEFRSFHDATWTRRQELHDRGETYLRRRAMESITMAAADAVLTLNEAMREELVRMGCSAEKIFLVPNGVDLEHFEARPRPAELAASFGLDDLPTYGYVSNMDHRRESQETLVRAAAELRRRGLEFRCVIVGGGPRREGIEQLAADLGVTDYVVFTGPADHMVVADYYGLIDVFVVPRMVERAAALVTPLKPFEAMAMGKPIVISDLPALREIAAPEERGLTFPPEDAVGLADAVQRLFEDPELAARIGESGYRWVVENRQWSMNGPRYVEAFTAAKRASRVSRA